MDGSLDGVFVPTISLDPDNLLELLRDHSVRTLFVGRGRLDEGLLRAFFEVSKGRIQPYHGSVDSEVEDVLRRKLVLEHGEIAGIVIYNEWHFLMNHSFILAKLRKAFDAMINAGAIALEVSKEKFDEMVCRTLHTEADTALSVRDRLRAGVKWTAAAGPSIAGLVNPIAGAVGGAAAGIFLLADP